MGDRTPEVNSVRKLTSKYITPCRTFGLKRRNTPKSDILKKLRSENTSSLVDEKSTNDRSISSHSTNSKTCLSPVVMLRKSVDNNVTPIKSIESIKPLAVAEPEELNVTPCNSRRKLSLKTKKQDAIDLNITPIKLENSLLSNGNSKSHSESQSPNVKLKNERNSSCTAKVQNSLDDTNTISESQILAQIKRINDKYSQLEKLKREQIYTRKHNLIELQKSTDKWLSAFKEISVSLHSELQERGRSCTILDVLVDHNVSPERVGFNVETLEFD